jgi:hypothetical protein
MAITSKTDICNLASDLLSGSTIADIDNPTTADESLYARWYDHCRKKALREHPWNFAIKRLIIAASSTAPVFGYQAAFPFPADFLRFVTIETEEGYQIDTKDFQIEGGSILLSEGATDATQVRLRYVYDIEDVTRFNSMFTDYLALTIALAVAFKVTESNTSVQRVQQLQKQQQAMSQAISGQERPPTRIVRSRNRTTRLNPSEKITHRIIF